MNSARSWCTEFPPACEDVRPAGFVRKSCKLSRKDYEYRELQNELPDQGETWIPLYFQTLGYLSPKDFET